MRRRKIVPAVKVSIVTAHTAECRGVDVFRVLERLKCPAQFQYRPPSGGTKCWTIPAQFAADVAALAEHLGGTAEVDGQGVLI